LERRSVGIEERAPIAAAQLTVQGCSRKVWVNAYARIKGVTALSPVSANAAARPLNVEEGLASHPGRRRQAPHQSVEEAHALDLAMLGCGVVILAIKSTQCPHPASGLAAAIAQ